MPSPLTINATHPARRVLVREPYSDHATWRDTFGPDTFLHAWSCDGSLDAPELIPAGSTFGTDYGPRSMMAVRGY